MHATSLLTLLLLASAHWGCARAIPRGLSDDANSRVPDVRTETPSPTHPKQAKFRLHLVIHGSRVPPVGAFIHCIEPTSNGALWVGGSTRVLRAEGKNWEQKEAPALGEMVVASDGRLFFRGLEGLWVQRDARWVARPAPKTSSIFTVLARTERDVYFLVYPEGVFHFDVDRVRSRKS